MIWRFPMTARALRRAIDAIAVQEAIRQAELRTSCEIRVCVSHVFWGDVRAMARRAFDRMGLARTAERNGILIFVVPSRRRFAILGDEGIHAKAGQPLWDQAAAILTARFKGDINELPDDVDYS